MRADTHARKELYGNLHYNFHENRPYGPVKGNALPLHIISVCKAYAILRPADQSSELSKQLSAAGALLPSNRFFAGPLVTQVLLYGAKAPPAGYRLRLAIASAGYRLRLAIASGERLGVVSFGAMNNSIYAISETIPCGFTMPYSFIKTAVADCAREFARPPLTNSCKESRSSAGTSYPLYRRKFLDPSVYHRLILLRQ